MRLAELLRRSNEQEKMQDNGQTQGVIQRRDWQSDESAHNFLNLQIRVRAVEVSFHIQLEYSCLNA